MERIILQNEILEVELSSIPVFKRWRHKPSGTDIDGCGEAGCLYINRKPMPWDGWDINIEKDSLKASYSLKHRQSGLGLVVTAALSGSVVKYIVDNIIEADEQIYSIEFREIPVFRFGQDFTFFRNNFCNRHWDSEIAKGLYWPENNYEEVSVAGAVPDASMRSNLHACAYNGRVCCFIKTNWPVLPLWSKAMESEGYIGRSEAFELGVKGWNYRVRDKITGNFEAHIEFVSDMNGDGKADECEYQLAMKKLLPEPDPLYRNAVWYKVDCEMPSAPEAFTTFKQALEIASFIHRLTNGRPQVMYLVGWQYNGHDTGYPAMDKLNENLGTREDLLYLINTAGVKYNCIVSVHTNIDDSYKEHPQWDPSIICRDTDGSLMKWEFYNNEQAYHISHTKDVESGDIFRRLEELLSIFPLKRSVHFDACRTMNWSWERDGFIGEAEELFCGILPIKQYMNGKGIDITTEGINGMGIEPAGIYSAFWHNGMLPLLYHNKLYGGGKGRTLYGYTAGTSVNSDFSSEHLDKKADELKDWIAMDYMLYSFYQMHEMIEFRSKGGGAYARYADGLEAYGDYHTNTLKVTWQDVLVADNTTRFIPFEDYIYVYATEDCQIERMLPMNWQDVELDVRALLTEAEVPEMRLENNNVSLKLHSRNPVVLFRK